MNPSKMDKIVQKVDHILAKYEDARNSDTMLILRFWEEYCDKIFGKVIYELGPKKIMYGLTSPETITRARRKITNNPVKPAWVPTPDVAQARRANQQSILDWSRRSKNES